MLLQKGQTAAGLHTQSSCLWDTTTDGNIHNNKQHLFPFSFIFSFLSILGSYTLRWENRHLHCVVTVFGVVNTDIVSVSM